MIDTEWKVVILIFSIVLTGLIIYFRKHVERLARWGYVGIFFASLLSNATILAPSPVLGLIVVEGRVLNPYVVGLVSALGGTLGEITGYLAGYGGQILLGEHPRLEQWIQDHGFAAIVLMAATPNPFFDVAGIVAGLTHFPIEQFLVATFLGTCIKYTLLALSGKYFLK